MAAERQQQHEDVLGDLHAVHACGGRNHDVAAPDRMAPQLIHAGRDELEQAQVRHVARDHVGHVVGDKNFHVGRWRLSVPQKRRGATCRRDAA